MSTSPRDKTIGIVGLSAIGSAIAQRLVEAGWSVNGFDPVEERALALVQRGGTSLDSPAAMVRVAPILLITPCEGVDPDTCLFGTNGALTGQKRPQIVIDAASTDVDKVRDLAERVDAQGVEYIDVTIAGGIELLRQGKALIVIGGGGAAVASCTDLVNAISSRSHHVGGPGQAACARLAMNLVLGLNRVVLAEGIAFAEQLGIDINAYAALLRASSSYAFALEPKLQKMITRDFSPQTKLKTHLNDSRAIMLQASRAGQSLPLTEIVSYLLADSIEAGDGELDNAAIIESLRRQRSQQGPGG
jgi:3-hydroxyisobutyrate dehydrogenase-like beta-hydroxyacid dehydrogenase